MEESGCCCLLTGCLILVCKGGDKARPSSVAMGISADVGVRESLEGEDVDVVEPDPSRKRDLVDGESWGAKWDLRLCRSIMLTAHSWRLTGVRLAAWRKWSLSCLKLSAYTMQKTR